MATHDDWRVKLDVSEDEVYPILARDRVWNSFAIADLLPPMRAYSHYALASQGDQPAEAACLVVQHPRFTVISPFGADDGIAAMLAQLAQLTLPAHALIQSQPNHLPLLERYYRPLTGWREMLRMGLTAETFRAPDMPSLAVQAVRLTLDDLTDLQALQNLYPETHFHPDLLRNGVFYGVRADAGRLVAAAGTHIVAGAYGIAVLGNIFTHPDARGRGYATMATAALITDLLAHGCRDIVLNVVADNHPAIHVYERLGFQSTYRYVTGEAGHYAVQPE